MSIEVIKKLQPNYIDDDSMTFKAKGKLTGLKNELIRYTIKQYELKDNKVKLVEDIQGILKRILNPASHHLLIPLYESELKKAIEGVQKLKEYFDQTIEAEN